MTRKSGRMVPGDGKRAPAVVSLPMGLRREEVLYFLGYPAGREPPDRIEALLGPLLNEARGLARARGAYRRIPVERAPDIALEPIAATGLVVGLVTAGGAIEGRASEYLREGNALSALILDAAGSAAAEEAADRLGVLIAGAPGTGRTGPDDADRTGAPSGVVAAEGAAITGAAAEPPPPISCRISPGYGRWPLTAQRSLFELLPHDGVGVRLLSSLLMVPRKSISFAMWLGADARPIAGLSGCARCGLETCRYRRVPRLDSRTDGGPLWPKEDLC